MKVIITGGRYYRLTDADLEFLDELRKTTGITEVVSGGASGVDADGEGWAHRNGISVRRFPADWDLYGKAAAPLRNRHMAEYADAAVVFPGGKGTESVAREARIQRLKVWDRRW